MPVARAGSNGKASVAQQALQLPKPEATKAWVLDQSSFSKGLVGGKSRVLAGEGPIDFSTVTHVPAKPMLPCCTIVGTETGYEESMCMMQW